jgi:hypothetical protein
MEESKELNPKIGSEASSDSSRERRFFISQPLQVTERFAKKLYENDDFYHSARFSLVAEAKKLFLYGCAHQVKKACIALIRQEELLEEPPDKELKKTQIGREITESVLDEQNLWIRKLLEILTNLINFQTSNFDKAYRIFLNSENLELFIGKQNDFKEFFDFTSTNVQSSIDKFLARIERDLSSLKQKGIWLLDEQWRKKRLPVFSSIRSRFKMALTLATDEEKIVLGRTYHDVFSFASLSMHGSIGSPVKDIGFHTVDTNFGHISLLALHIINRANKLMNFDEPQDIDRLISQGSIGPQLMERSRKKFEIGDLVIAYNDLAEVMEVKESKYGYTAYLVKFLGKPPLPETPEDWLPSEHITRIVAKNKVREIYRQSFEKYQNQEEATMVMEQSDQLLYESMKRMLIELDTRGLLIQMLLNGQYRDDTPV